MGTLTKARPFRCCLSPVLASQRAALDKVLTDIEDTFGKGAVMRLGDKPTEKVATFSSGSLTLDLALGGGIPRGRIIEIFGPESSGKTTLAMHAMASAQRAGGNAALIDAEHAFDATYGEKMGLNVRDLLLSQPSSGEEALEIADRLCRSHSVDVIAVDSVAALVPQTEIQGEMGMVQVGAQARLMSQALRKLAISASKTGTTVIFLNQLRNKIGVLYGSPETTSGGNALKFYASCRMDIRRIGTIPDKPAAGESHTGIRCKVKVVKNKVAPPYRIAEFDVMFGSGISHAGCVVDAAEQAGIIVRKGSWYSYKDQQLGQGRDKTLAALQADAALCADIEAAVRTQLDSIPVPIEAGDGEDDEGSEEAVLLDEAGEVSAR